MNSILVSIGIFSGIILLGLVVRFFVVAKLSLFFAKTETKIDDLTIESIKGHILFWFFLLALYYGLESAPIHPKIILHAEKAALATFILSFSIAMSHFLSGLVRLQTNKLSLPATSLTENLLKGVIIGIGVLLILSNLGISITPLLTALGVGSLAVALALQDTLSDLFAGIYIVANRQIKVNDYVKLDSGQEGYVVDIGWKVTKIRELPNNIIIIPNSKLSKAILTNYHLPEKEMSVVFQVGVSYDSDLEKVESVTIAVAREIQKVVQGGVTSFEPFIRYHTFGESSVNFSVILRVQEYTDRYLLIHEFIKMLHNRYTKEGITIPFPQRVLHIREGSEKVC